MWNKETLDFHREKAVFTSRKLKEIAKKRVGNKIILAEKDPKDEKEEMDFSNRKTDKNLFLKMIKIEENEKIFSLSQRLN